MCGIAGFITLEPHTYPDSVADRMTRSIAHRGPDDSRVYRDPHAVLGHRRLSIIDLTTGQQPMTSESGDRWIVYNGEIFNHAALRPKLEARGHQYHSHSDTETILHAFEEYGSDCVAHFRGMFAFAIWNRRTRTLFCARDRLGIKPFYYFWSRHEFIFASEIKALLEHPSVSAELEESLLAEHLAYGYASGEQTLFRGVRQLMPGHTLTLDTAGKLEIQQYWDVPAPVLPDQRGEQDWMNDCRHRLEESVRMRLMSDVPLGMFLSGGVDSSLIAAIMKPMAAGPVKTFAVGYREAEYSELGFAREAATAIGTEHREVQMGADDFFNALPKLIWHEDKPITWPSSISLYFVSKFAAEQVKVVLTGEGSDELFGGYNRYRVHLMNQRMLGAWTLLPGGLRRTMREQIAESPLISDTVRRKLSHTVAGMAEDFESLYLDNFYSAFPAAERDVLLRDAAGASAHESYFRYRKSSANRSELDRLLYADQKTYLAELLMKQDRMSMAASIESRVPFLDHPFVEFSTRVPILDRTGKSLIKRVADTLLPPSIVHRKKMGFPTPLRVWLKEARLQPVLDQMTSRRGFLASVVDIKAVDELLARHRGGRLDATDRLWRLLNLHLWGEIFLLKRRDPCEALLGVPASV